MNYEHISEALKFNQADYLGFLMRSLCRNLRKALEPIRTAGGWELAG